MTSPTFGFKTTLTFSAGNDGKNVASLTNRLGPSNRWLNSDLSIWIVIRTSSNFSNLPSLILSARAPLRESGTVEHRPWGPHSVERWS